MLANGQYSLSKYIALFILHSGSNRGNAISGIGKLALLIASGLLQFRLVATTQHIRISKCRCLILLHGIVNFLDGREFMVEILGGAVTD